MSRRYGRQQKLAARAAISDLDIKLSRAQKDAAKYRRAFEEQRSELESLIERLHRVCPFSALVPPRYVDFWRGDLHQVVEFAEREDLKLFPCEMIDITGPTLKIVRVDCHAVDVFIEANRPTLQRLVHVRIGMMGTVGYAISEQTLYAMDKLDNVRGMVAESIVRAITTWEVGR